MDPAQEYIDELIAKHLAGEASAEESRRLRQWADASPQNQSYYHESLTLFRHIDGLAEQPDLDLDKAWKKAEQRISPASGTKMITLFPRKFYRMAAAVALVALLGLLVYSVLPERDPVPVHLVASKKVEEKYLPDGSKVILNRQSQIEYATDKNRREVKLRGEAFFEVVHDQTQPFVISVNEVMIEDIGTAFNVKALPGSELVEVYVTEGEVRFYTADQNGVSLKKGQSASYSRRTRTFRLENSPADANVLSYKTREFEFNTARLGDIIVQLSAVYDVEIGLENAELANCRLSVSFHNEDPALIMEVLAETLDLKLVRSGNTFLLKGEKCH